MRDGCSSGRFDYFPKGGSLYSLFPELHVKGLHIDCRYQPMIYFMLHRAIYIFHG